LTITLGGKGLLPLEGIKACSINLNIVADNATKNSVNHFFLLISKSIDFIEFDLQFKF
jgi:hypothetical protein